jgi:hypothetical protein
MKTAIDMIEGLRYKLRMMGIPLIGPTSVVCDNESVVRNSTAPESTLKKRHNAIAYHRAREAQTAGFIRVACLRPTLSQSNHLQLVSLLHAHLTTVAEYRVLPQPFIDIDDFASLRAIFRKKKLTATHRWLQWIFGWTEFIGFGV